MMDALPPSLRQRFQEIAILGRGASGVAVRAIQRDLGREVVLKVLGVLDPELLLRFEREARILCGFRDPAILSLLDHGVVDGVPYLVSPFHPGTSLDDLLRAKGRLPPGQVVSLAIELTRALAVVHEAGVLHRDLKPANILLTEEGQPVLLDFGLGALEGGATLTATGMFLGTPAYTAPELLMGARATERSDLYSLGVTLLELAAGTNPFVGRTVAETVNLQINLRPDRLPDVGGRVPRELAREVLQMLDKDPVARPLSARDLHRSLHAQQESSGTHPEESASAVTAVLARRALPPDPPSAPERAGVDRGIRGDRRRHRWLVVPALAALVALLAVIGSRSRTVPVTSSTPEFLALPAERALEIVVPGARGGSLRLGAPGLPRFPERILPVEAGGRVRIEDLPAQADLEVDVTTVTGERSSARYRTVPPLKIWDMVHELSDVGLLLDFEFAGVPGVEVTILTDPAKALLHRKRSSPGETWFHDVFEGLQPSRRHWIRIAGDGAWGRPVEILVETRDREVGAKFRETARLLKQKEYQVVAVDILDDSKMPQGLRLLRELVREPLEPTVLLRAMRAACSYRDRECVERLWDRFTVLAPDKLPPAGRTYLLGRMMLARHRPARAPFLASLPFTGDGRTLEAEFSDIVRALGREPDPLAFDAIHQLFQNETMQLEPPLTAIALMRTDPVRALSSFEAWARAPAGDPATWRIRVLGLTGLAIHGSPATGSVLRDLVESADDAGFRETVLGIMHEFGEPPPADWERLFEKVPWSRSLLRGIASRRIGTVISRLEARAASPERDPVERGWSLMTLASLAPPGSPATPRICRDFLASADPGLRRAAVWSIGRLRDVSFLTDLETASSPGRPECPVAIWALGRLEGSRAREVMLRFLRLHGRRTESRVQMAAAIAIGMLGDRPDREDRAVLVELARESSLHPWVRLQLEQSLDSSRPPGRSWFAFTFAPLEPLERAVWPEDHTLLHGQVGLQVEGFFQGIGPTALQLKRESSRSPWLEVRVGGRPRAPSIHRDTAAEPAGPMPVWLEARLAPVQPGAGGPEADEDYGVFEVTMEESIIPR